MRVIVTFGTTVHTASFHLNACNLSHLVSSCVFLLTNLLGGYLSLGCRNLCYNEFSLWVFCVGIGGMGVCDLVDLLNSVGGRVDRDSPAKFYKFYIVSMGSRTNLGDFVLWFCLWDVLGA